MSADKTVDERQNPRSRRFALRERAKQEPAETRSVTTRGRSSAPAKQEEEAAPQERTGFLEGLRDYFEGVRTELRKVAWPSREDTRRLSIIVLLVLILASIALGAVSFLFTELFRLGLDTPFLLIGFMVLAVVIGVVVNRMGSRRSSL